MAEDPQLRRGLPPPSRLSRTGSRGQELNDGIDLISDAVQAPPVSHSSQQYSPAISPAAVVAAASLPSTPPKVPARKGPMSPRKPLDPSSTTTQSYYDTSSSGTAGNNAQGSPTISHHSSLGFIGTGSGSYNSNSSSPLLGSNNSGGSSSNNSSPTLVPPSSFSTSFSAPSPPVPPLPPFRDASPSPPPLPPPTAAMYASQSPVSASASSSLLYSTPRGRAPLLLKVHFPWYLWKVLQFDADQTVSDAIEYLKSKNLVASKQNGLFGIFIPAWYGNSSSGWLEHSRTLGSYNLHNHDIIEFRETASSIEVQTKRAVVSVVVPDTETIRGCMPTLLSALSPDDIFTSENYPERSSVVRLDSNVLLLHLPLPHPTQFVLLREPAGTHCLCVRLPHLKGGLLVKKTSRVKENITKERNPWKELWADLDKDKITFYATPFETTASSFIPIQRIIDVRKTPAPSDAPKAKKEKTEERCLVLEVVDDVLVYLMSKDSISQWCTTIEDWLRFRPFFGPESWLSQQFFENKAAAKSLPSGSGNTQQALPGDTARKSSLSSRQSMRLKRLTVNADPAMQLAIQSALLGAGDFDMAPTPSAAASASAASPQQASSQSSSASLLHQAMPASPSLSTTPSSPSTDASSSEDGLIVTVALADGTTQKVSINPSWEVYDLVYALGEELGSHRVPIITPFDSGEDRRIELLDHQKSYAQQKLPENVTLLLKKTGIVDDFVGPDDIYDNHFLYVQLPFMESFAYIGDHRTPSSLSLLSSWRRVWITMKIDKLLFFESDSSMRPLATLNIFFLLSAEITPSGTDPHDPCRITLKTKTASIHLRADNPSQAQKWVQLLNSWIPFWTAQNTIAARRAPNSAADDLVASILSSTPKLPPSRQRALSNEIQRTDTAFWQYLEAQQEEYGGASLPVISPHASPFEALSGVTTIVGASPEAPQQPQQQDAKEGKPAGMLSRRLSQFKKAIAGGSSDNIEPRRKKSLSDPPSSEPPFFVEEIQQLHRSDDSDSTIDTVQTLEERLRRAEERAFHAEQQVQYLLATSTELRDALSALRDEFDAFKRNVSVKIGI